MRGLTGAVLNNFFLMKSKGMYLCILVAAVAMIGYLITDNAIFRQAAPMIFLLLLALSTLNSSNIAFDSKWNRIEKLWSVSPLVMITSRYIIYLAISLVLAALWVASPFHDGNLQNIADFVTLVLLVGALYYPVMYLFNSDHNLGILVIFFSAFLAFMVMNWVTSLFNHSWEDGFSLVLFGVVCGIYVTSLVLSLVFNRIHMGRGA